MESIDFRSLSERLRTELSRVYFWQKIVRILSIIVYLFVFCWMMFVLFGGYLVGYIGLENYSVVTQYIFPVFMGFIVLNFAFSRSLMKFQGQENDIMRSIMSAMFPSVLFSFSSQLDQRILSGSRLFNSSFSDPALAATTYAYLEVPWGDRTLYIVDIGVSYGLMNKLELNSVTGYLVMLTAMYSVRCSPPGTKVVRITSAGCLAGAVWSVVLRVVRLSCPTIWNKRPAIWQRISRA